MVVKSTAKNHDHGFESLGIEDKYEGGIGFYVKKQKVRKKKRKGGK